MILHFDTLQQFIDGVEDGEELVAADLADAREALHAIHCKLDMLQLEIETLEDMIDEYKERLDYAESTRT